MSQRNPTCVKCKATSSLMWQKSSNGTLICLDCQTAEKKANSNSLSPQSTKSTASSNQSDRTVQNDKNLSQLPGPTTRRSTRSRERANKAKQQSTLTSQDSSTVTTESLNDTNPPVVSTSSPAIQNDIKDSVKEESKCDKPVKERELVQPPPPVPVLKDHHVNQWERNRRSLSLKLFQPVKSLTVQPEVVTSDSINHNVRKN